MLKFFQKPKRLLADTETLNERYGSFSASPFERGFGSTVGTALRRVLLSSIEGAAITAVRIEGVEHEFSPIPGIVEDATDIILNLKQVPFKMNTEAVKTVRIVVDTVGDIMSGQIETDADVEVLDKNIRIATVSEGGKLTIDMRLRQNRGYISAERNSDDDLPLGYIPVDSVHTPVSKVNFKVETTRQGGSADYDKLQLELWTNGAIAPVDAVGQAAKLLKDHMPTPAKSELVAQALNPSLFATNTLKFQTHETQTRVRSEIPRRLMLNCNHQWRDSLASHYSSSTRPRACPICSTTRYAPRSLHPLGDMLPQPPEHAPDETLWKHRQRYDHQMTRSLPIVLFALRLSAQEVSQSGQLLTGERPLIAQAERAKHGMVASVNEIATLVGVDILKQGGNAVDSAVAVGFALAVVHPEAGNIAGGGYMLVRMADGRATAFDYKEMAPSAAHPGMFVIPQEQSVGYKASAVPGTVAGFAMAHRKYGKLSWTQVIEPARLLAKNGFPASQRMELILALQVPVMKQFPESAKIFLHGKDTPLKQGEIVVQADLAATLLRIQKNGAREFYEGITAQRIADDMQANNGKITLDDLKAYRAVEREPIQGSYRGHPILAMGPSSSGGTAVIQMLNILENFPLKLGEEGSAKARHLHVEAARRAFKDRAEFAGDPAFFDIPTAKLLSKEHASQWAKGIDLAKASPFDVPSSNRESNETTHFSVIDAQGNIVSNTYTLNGFYGSQVIAKGTGVLLNNIMGGFAQRGRNKIDAHKRPVSSMSPVIVLNKDNTPWMALGSPGSQTIPNTVLQVIGNMIDFKMSLRDAIEYPRIHFQGSPDRIDAEPAAMVTEVADKLKAMGHKINPVFRSQGDVHAVAVEPGTGMRLGWSDGRRGGKAIGY